MRYILCSIFLFLLAFSAVWAYSVNYDTRKVVSRIQIIKGKISVEEEKRSMLEGEWAYLNRPERLSILSERFFNHLELMPISTENFANINAIKMQSTKEFDSQLVKKTLDKASMQSQVLR